MRDGGAAAARVLARGDVRRHWRGLIALGLLVGLTAGFAIAALSGARRAGTALTRFRTATNAADGIVFASQVGAFHPDWDRLRARPEVADLAVWNLMFGVQDGEPGGPLFVARDGAFLGRVNRPLVVAGRMWDPAAPDEAVVTRAVAEELPVGSTFEFQSFRADQGDDEERPAGPTTTFRVVGVVDTVNTFLFTDQIVIGPGFTARYGGEVQFFENADVRLKHGSADMEALRRDASEFIAPGTPVLDLHAVSRRVDTTTGVEHAALLLLAGSVAVAGGVLVAQAMIRSASVPPEAEVVLRAIGLTSANRALAVALAHLVAAGATVVAASAVAVGTSPLFPVGLSRQLEPDRGVHVDWAVLLPGVVLASALLLLGAGWVAVRSGRTRRGPARWLTTVTAAVRSRAPVSIGIGTTMAVDGGAGRARVPARPALTGAAIGVLGVVAALTIQHGIDDALAHPERAGVTWNVTIIPGPASYEAHGLAPDLVDAAARALPPGSALAAVGRFVLPVDGVGVAAFTLEPSAGRETRPITFAITKGRAPAAAGEAAVGPKTASDLHAAIGDTVRVGDEGSPVRIVGYALFPPDVHSEFDEGIWLTPDRFAAVVPVVSAEHLFEGAERALLVRFPSGGDHAAMASALGRDLGDSVAGVAPAELPVELTNLRNVRQLPVLLAGFLAVLAIGAVSHVLVASSRRREREFAVLRAIGLHRRATRAVLNAQGTTVGLVGLLLGLPLGVVAGRTGWHWIAGQVPLRDVPPFALLAVLAIGPAAVVAVNAIAVWPGQRVARLRPAEALRAE